MDKREMAARLRRKAANFTRDADSLTARAIILEREAAEEGGPPPTVEQMLDALSRTVI